MLSVLERYRSSHWGTAGCLDSGGCCNTGNGALGARDARGRTASAMAKTHPGARSQYQSREAHTTSL